MIATQKEANGFKNPILISAIIICLACLGPFAADIYLPSLPNMATALHSDAHTMEFSITAYLLGFSLMQIVYGPLADRFGRKPIIVTGLLICLLGTIGCIFAANGTELIISRIIQGIGMAGVISLIRTIMVDVFKGKRFIQAASFIGTFFSLSPALAPIVGGYLDFYFHWRASFIFLVIYVLLTLFLVLFVFPETNKNRDRNATRPKTMLANYTRLLSSKTFLGYMFCSSFAIATLFVYATASPFLFQKILHLNPVQYGWLSIVIAFGLITSKTLNGVFASKFGMERMLLFGMCIITLSGFLMLILSMHGSLNLPAIVIPLMGVIIGSGFVTPNSTAGAFIPFADIAGSTGALFGCLQIGGCFIASGIIAAMNNTTQTPMALMFTILGVLGIVCYFGLIQTDSIEPIIAD